MSSLFGPRRGRVKPPKRNRFDMSHQHLDTTDFGLVKPFFCKEVIGGDSVSLDPVCAIRSHPIVFPINTRMRMYAHYFYVRNRTLWKDWENFIFKTKEGLTPPYLQLTPERAKKMISTGSLGDCLGVPSTIGYDGSVSGSFSIDVDSLGRYGTGRNPATVMNRTVFSDYINSLVGVSSLPHNTSYQTSYFQAYSSTTILAHTKLSNEFFANIFGYTGQAAMSGNMYMFFSDSSGIPLNQEPIAISMSIDDSECTIRVEDRFDLSTLDFATDFKIWFASINSNSNGNTMTSPGLGVCVTNYVPFMSITQSSSTFLPDTISFSYDVDGMFDATDDSVLGLNKFVGDNPRIPLSALPFRACEMISNYFFRNDQNNPYILNGEAQYNQFIPTIDGGPDTNEYLIHHRNWEFDAYTSAVPSPQFGAAPLVGVTYAGGREAELTFQGSDSDGVVQDYKVKVGLADDGVIQSVIDFDKGIPSGSLRELIDLSSVGISINDLRNVNAYQRFKENCLRRSLRYRDQMLSHLGVNVDYPDIDVPQFIGGFSGDLVVSPVTNMAETETAMLGDVAGKIEAVIKSNHRITCYCPEHGFIIGMFSIVPIPTYSQLLPKAFTRYDAFDYFQSEFGKIGYVPIFHRELFPLQSDDPDKVFGYQRAWYEYMSSPDEVHGDFRTSLSDFVLYRTFKDEPTLNEDFTTVQSDSLNNIFAVDKVDEKYKNSEHFMVQFYHDAVFKRPIPKYGMPSLE